MITAPTLLHEDAMLRTEQQDKLMHSRGHLFPISCVCFPYARWHSTLCLKHWPTWSKVADDTVCIVSTFPTTTMSGESSGDASNQDIQALMECLLISGRHFIRSSFLLLKWKQIRQLRQWNGHEQNILSLLHYREPWTDQRTIHVLRVVLHPVKMRTVFYLCHRFPPLSRLDLYLWLPPMWPNLSLHPPRSDLPFHQGTLGLNSICIYSPSQVHQNSLAPLSQPQHVMSSHEDSKLVSSTTGEFIHLCYTSEAYHMQPWWQALKRPTLTKSASCSSRDNRGGLVAPRDDGKSPRGQDWGPPGALLRLYILYRGLAMCTLDRTICYATWQYSTVNHTVVPVVPRSHLGSTILEPLPSFPRPSELGRARGMYFGNDRNRFWKVLTPFWTQNRWKHFNHLTISYVRLNLWLPFVTAPITIHYKLHSGPSGGLIRVYLRPWLCSFYLQAPQSSLSI